jgi:hypothetical protein
MRKLGFIIALMSMFSSLLACSLFTPGGLSPSTTSPESTSAAAMKTKVISASQTSPKPEATEVAAPTKTPIPAVATLPPDASPSVVVPTKATQPPTVPADQLNACLNALPVDIPPVVQMVTSGNTQGAHPLLVCDNFTDNNNGWSLGDYNGKYVTGNTTIANGAYHWDGIAPDGAVWYDYASTNPPVNDFSIAINSRIISGPADTYIGIFYRDDNENFYLFKVNSKEFKLSIFYQGEWEELIPLTPVPDGFTVTDAPGWIIVDVVGDIHTFYLNNDQVGMFTDSRLTAGIIDIGIDLDANATDRTLVEFYHLVLRGE